DLERGKRGCLDAVEAAGVFQHRGIAVAAHGLDDGGNRRIDLRILRGFERDQALEARFEVRIGGAQPRDSAHRACPARLRRRSLARTSAGAAACSNASINGCTSACLSLSAAWFTTRRAEMGMISSPATRSFAFSVEPVLTR